MNSYAPGFDSRFQLHAYLSSQKFPERSTVHAVQFLRGRFLSLFPGTATSRFRAVCRKKTRVLCGGPYLKGAGTSSTRRATSHAAFAQKPTQHSCTVCVHIENRSHPGQVRLPNVDIRVIHKVEQMSWWQR